MLQMFSLDFGEIICDPHEHVWVINTQEGRLQYKKVIDVDIETAVCLTHTMAMSYLKRWLGLPSWVIGMKCRECGDTATHFVYAKEGIMPWYYCTDCKEELLELGHESKFVELPACCVPKEKSSV